MKPGNCGLGGNIIVPLSVLGTAAAWTHVDEESSATGPTQAHLLLRTSLPNGIEASGLAEMTSSRGREREPLSASRENHSIFINLPVLSCLCFSSFQITSHMLGLEVKRGLEI